jgi:HK97 family phage portal protein
MPTVDLDFAEWCSQVLTSLLLHGNGYVAVLRNERNTIVELVPLDPTVVEVTRQNGRKVYVVNGARYPGELVHIKGLMLPGSDVGYSPVEAARQAIGLGMAATKFGGEFFAGEGNMPGVIELPKPAQPDTMRDMAEQWRRKRSRGGRGLPGVLQDGATWKPTGVTNEQAQFLSTRGYTAAEIAGQMFLLDPSDLGIPVEGTSLTYANLEQRNARRVQVTLLPWIVRVERAVSALLFNPRYMRFNLEGLLRGDTLTRYQTYQIGIPLGVLQPSEAREFEDLPPIPGAPLPPGEAPDA